MDKDSSSHAQELERIEECDFWSKAKTQLILGLVEGECILDIGCGGCLLSKTLSDKKYTVVAIDNDSKAVEIARNKGINGYVVDIAEWKTDRKFDCIIAADVLEHVNDDRLVIKKIYGMLKPNGCFVVNVPSYRFLFGEHDVSLGHKRRYSATELRIKLEEAGFKIEYQRHWNLLALPVTILITKIMKKDYPHEQISRVSSLSKILERLLLIESKINYLFGISILSKARKKV